METAVGVVVTGQQIGAGWSPALSVVKALAAHAEAKRRDLRAVYWLADEDHDHAEVASVVGLRGGQLVRHRFSFDAPPGTSSGWLEWTAAHQGEAQSLWGLLPIPLEPSLRGHVMALGGPLWARGVEPFSPTKDADRAGIQGELERWRSLDLEADLCQQADLLESRGEKVVLDPRRQSAWFSLDPTTGQRARLECGQPCPKGHWLSPGAALRPLMQSLLLPVEAVVLGPGEMAYWKLIERIWDRLGLMAPAMVPRPSVFVLDDAPCDIPPEDMERLRLGRWGELAAPPAAMPSAVPLPEPSDAWGEAVSGRFRAETARLRLRLERLDARLARDAAKSRFGADPERLRQTLFPLGRPQERDLPGWQWLKDPQLLDAIESRVAG
jgi:hypothetical protein